MITSRSVVRVVLGGLLALVALNAFGGGYYGMAGADGVPTAWLDGTPFTTYLIPSVILFVVVGGSMLLASIAVLARWSIARRIALLAGAVVLGWICVQVAMIGYVSWMQPTTFVAGLVVVALAAQLDRAGAALARPGDR